MNRNIRKLWIRALCGSGGAYLRLGMAFLAGRGCRRDRRLARVCLRRAMELGSEKGYLLYHRLFSGGRRVIDDPSYRAICREYEKETDRRRKRVLKRYLELGTEKQKKAAKNGFSSGKGRRGTEDEAGKNLF